MTDSNRSNTIGNCPALTRGSIAGCRSCIYQAGGPGSQCLVQFAKWQKRQVSDIKNYTNETDVLIEK